MTDEQLVEDLRSHLDRLTSRDAFSGTVLLAKGDRVLFQRAYGFANRAFNARNTLDTKLNLGSMGKMFTAVVSRPRRERDRRSPGGSRDWRPSVGRVARSGDLATTWAWVATIPGSDSRPVPQRCRA